jgi:hypothetical protein
MTAEALVRICRTLISASVTVGAAMQLPATSCVWMLASGPRGGAASSAGA